ncbi:Hypothetical protein A7982_06384 [Minicystis rosea]|nr:Hypothetical protein A7982_06384 [Minicystis rosea]
MACPPTCTTDADCQNACPSSGPEYTTCCDSPTGVCFVGMISICPLACAPGAVCQPGTCTLGASSCIEQCTCDDTGHYVCKSKSDLPTCPAVHHTCGDPCDPSVPLGCMCTLGPGQGEAPCTCDAATSKWLCADPSIVCPPYDVMYKGVTCTDFPAGLVCNWGCFCQADCGTQYWYCGL